MSQFYELMLELYSGKINKMLDEIFGGVNFFQFHDVGEHYLLYIICCEIIFGNIECENLSKTDAKGIIMIMREAHSDKGYIRYSNEFHGLFFTETTWNKLKEHIHH